MGRETSSNAPPRGRNARMSIKNVTFDVAEKDCCLLHPFDAGPASSSDSVPTTPLLSDLVRMGSAALPKITFRGWTAPGFGWEAWVRDMASDEKIVSAWRKAGIKDAILGSVANVKPDRALMEALFGFWCHVTRTFIFPWGEATFTLEDTYIIGNLPISGRRLDRELTDEEEDLRLRLFVEKEKIRELHPMVKITRKVTLDIWLQWFLELRGEEELKYLGFLAYWLAKNVVPPYPAGEVPNVVFGLAARLSCGDRIALAPLVTANIYHDLSKITSVLSKPEKRRRGNKIDVWAQFSLLQAWVWGRFESLRPLPQGAGPLVSESRISHWGSRKIVTRYHEAVSIFHDERSYAWRPYSSSSSCWKEPPWYGRETQIIHVEEGMPDWVHDYVTIISPSTLQGFYGDGLISSERYHPNRVSRQFGYDQSIPVLNCSLAPSFANNVHQVGPYMSIPKITRYGNPRRDYLAWWQNHKVEYQKALDDYAMPAGPAPDLVDNHKREIKATKGKGKDLVNGFTSSRTSFEASYHQKYCEEQENKEYKDFLAGPEANQTELLKEKKKEPLSFTDSQGQESNSRLKVKEIDSNISKSLGDEMHQCAERKRKLEIKDASTKRDISYVPSKDVIVIDDDSDEDLVDSGEEEKKLVDELEEFLRCGLLNEWEPSSPEPEDEKNSRKCCSDSVRKNGDPYGKEAIRMYPRFFVLIPQKPHYRGLLDDSISEEVRQDVYLSKWYRLVDLMKKALQTTWQTDPSEVENLLMEARKFEGFGFNVKHIIARLKESQARLRRLKVARITLEEAEE